MVLMGCSGSGEIRATDGKIKAPTYVRGMWLVGLSISCIGGGVPAGAEIAKSSDFNTVSAIRPRFANANRYDRWG
jgi:hypothetical protein